MAQNNSGLILLVGGAAVAWYGYTQGWFASLFGTPPVVTPTPTPVSTGTATGCVAPSTIVNGVCTAPYVAPANPPQATVQYSGPGTTSAGGVALVAQLATAYGGLNPPPMNIDQWAYYYNLLSGVTPLTGGQITSMLAAAGATNNRSGVLMNPAQFVALLSSAAGVPGLSGFGQVGYRRIPVPTMVRPAYGRGMGQYTMADLRRAGRR
jgi:hypothetical protein